MNNYSLAFILFVVMISCTSVVFSKRELKFANNVSSLLNGAKITVKKGIEANSQTTSFSIFKVIVEDCRLDSVKPESSVLFVTSIPALMLVTDSVLEKQSYHYVEINVKNATSQEISTRYLLSDLFKINACVPSLAGYIYGIKKINKDSLSYYSEAKVDSSLPVVKLIPLLMNTDENYGVTGDVNIDGFKIDSIDRNKSVIFFTTLHRPKAEHKIEIGINLETRKVNYLNL